MTQAEKWQKDLAVYQDINTTFIIEGSVHDLQPWIYEDDGTCEPVALSLYLQRYLTEEGYDPVVFYNRIDGFSILMHLIWFQHFIEKCLRMRNPPSQLVMQWNL